MLTYLQAIILGIFQGVTELFPVSGLGHSVLLANLFGWDNLSARGAEDGSFVNLLIMIHMATAIALIIFYRTEWVRIARGFMRSLHGRQIGHDGDAKLAWLLIAATVPIAIIGALLESTLRAQFATAFFAIIFIIINGILLLKGDKLITKAELARPRNRSETGIDESQAGKTARVISDHLTLQRAVLIGLAQVGALFAGISRSGITMLAGLRSGLNHQDAARFSFLLATPIILGTGIYKLPGLVENIQQGSGGPIIVGSVIAGISAYFSVRFLDRYFRNNPLRPFGWYCIGVGVFVLLVNIIRGA